MATTFFLARRYGNVSLKVRSCTFGKWGNDGTWPGGRGDDIPESTGWQQEKVP